METSLILYLRPNLVRPLSEAGDGKAKKFIFKAMQEGWAWSERKWTQITADTGVGDPRQGSAEKGEKYFKTVTQKVAKFFTEIASTSKKDFYI